MVAAGTFSNSTVITSVARTSDCSALGSSKAPVIVRLATWLAGQPASGSSTTVCSPSREADKASMRPSWPPPRMPMVEPGGIGKLVMA